MPQIKFGENGEVLDAQTGKVIGKMGEKGLVLDSAQQVVKGVETTQNNAESTQTVKDTTEATNTVKNELCSATGANKVPSSFVIKKTKYEVTQESNFTVYFGVYEKEGRFIIINKDAVENFPEAELCWVKFRMWNYDEELLWKSQSMDFNYELKSQFINQSKLNEKKIKQLMLDWSFAENNDRLKLLHTDGILSDESYKIFKGMFPSIANSIIDLMNSVLEQNQ